MTKIIPLSRRVLLFLLALSLSLSLAALLLAESESVVATHSAGEADVLTRAANCAAVINGRCLRVGYWGGELRMNGLGYGVQPTGVAPGTNFTQFGMPSAYWGDIQDANPNSVNEFIEWHRFTLTNPGGYCASYNVAGDPYCSSRVQSASAYVVNSMLGVDGNSFGCASSANRNPGDPVAGDGPDNCRNAAFSRAISLFGEWEKLVRLYESRDWITWHSGHYQPCGEINTSAVYGRHANFPRDVVQWDQDFWCNSWVPVIIFRHPGGATYLINKSCANSKGFTALSAFRLQSSIYQLADVATNTAVTNGRVEPGREYRLSMNIQNQGTFFDGRPGNRPAFLRVRNQNPTYALPSNPPGPPYYGMSEANLADAGKVGYLVDDGAPNSGSDDFYCGGIFWGGGSLQKPCWIWQYYVFGDYLSANYSANVHSTFRVADNAPNNTQLCFNVTNVPTTPISNEYPGNNGCWTVVTPMEPYLTTEFGSLHAGADWGDQCFYPGAGGGTVTGRVRNNVGSKADYIVSAGGDINNFGSVGSPTGSALTLGNSSGVQPFGKYGTVCRPDLAHQLLSEGGASASPGTIDVDDIPNGITKYIGNLTLNSVSVGAGCTNNFNSGQRSTIVVQGDVYIQRNIVVGASCTFNSLGQIPSFGVIATGNILINPNVQEIYGIYYAGTDHTAWGPGHAPGGIINTCRVVPPWGIQPDPPSIITNASLCNRTLRINGALIANNVYFRRTSGDARTGSGAAETVSYLPQLLLRPPLGMIGLSAQIRSFGERPPLF